MISPDYNINNGGSLPFIMFRIFRLAVLFPPLCMLHTALAAEPPAPFGAVLHERQVAWQRMEYDGFVHFGLNTWIARETHS